MTVTVKELQKRVKRGAHFLDKQTPKWADEIQLPQLDMSKNDACILGQVYGDFDSQSEIFGLKKWVESRGEYVEERAIRHGFTLLDKDMEKKQNWSRLAELWAIEVAVRQARS